MAGSQPRDSRLEEMPEAVQLVPGLKIRIPRRLPGPTEARVQVPVRPLGGRDPSCQRLVAPLECAGVLAAQLPGHGLEKLVDLGVDELDAAVAAADVTGRRPVKVAGPADALHPRLAVLEDRVRVQPLLLFPDAAGNLDLVGAKRAPDRGGRLDWSTLLSGRHQVPRLLH
jgi:hypothetical protein